MSVRSRDCLRCRRSPVIKRARPDLASVSVVCKASASLINATRLVPGLSPADMAVDAGPDAVFLAVASYSIAHGAPRGYRLGTFVSGSSSTDDDSMRIALSVGSIAASPLSGCQA